MTSRRLLKAAQAVRQAIGMAILTELRDPRVQNVTVTRVEMAPDMREAKVYVSIMGDVAQQNLGLHGLQSARGFLQAKLAERIETRYIPRLHFILDLGVKRSLEVARILRDVLPENRSEADNATLREAEAQNAELGVIALQDAEDHPADSNLAGSDLPDSDSAGSDAADSEASADEHGAPVPPTASRSPRAPDQAG
jgi:ribosome-binding factor A